MKVIFLDNDGVMCLVTEWGSRAKKMTKWEISNTGTMPAWIKMDNFNKKAVEVLNYILLETGAEIVVSSDWKLYCTLEELQEMFLEYGVTKAPIDVTPSRITYKSKFGFSKSDLEQWRMLEIKEWLKEHPEVTHWVAVDDLDLSERFGPVSGHSNGGLKNFVLTPKSLEGIKQSGIKEKIIKFLND